MANYPATHVHHLLQYCCRQFDIMVSFVAYCIRSEGKPQPKENIDEITLDIGMSSIYELKECFREKTMDFLSPFIRGFLHFNCTHISCMIKVGWQYHSAWQMCCHDMNEISLNNMTINGTENGLE